jgi:hypothetical protein
MTFTNTQPLTDDASSYLDYIQPEVASEDVLSSLAKLAEEQIKAVSEVAEAEAQLSTAKEKLKDLAERQIPDLMDQVGLEDFKTSSGLIIEVNETIRAAIPKEHEHRGIAWLKEHGHEALVKRVVSVAFGKGEDGKAQQLYLEMAKRYDVEDKASVHPSTLSAFVREQLEAGEEIPLDLLGVHRQRVAKVKVSTMKKTSAKRK